MTNSSKSWDPVGSSVSRDLVSFSKKSICSESSMPSFMRILSRAFSVWKMAFCGAWLTSSIRFCASSEMIFSKFMASNDLIIYYVM